MSISNNNQKYIKPAVVLQEYKPLAKPEARPVVIDKEAVMRTLKNMFTPIADLLSVKEPAHEMLPDEIEYMMGTYNKISDSVSAALASERHKIDYKL